MSCPREGTRVKPCRLQSGRTDGEVAAAALHPGESWRGRGVDLLFRDCSQQGEEVGSLGESVSVKMKVSLPRERWSFETEAKEVRLECPQG